METVESYANKYANAALKAGCAAGAIAAGAASYGIGAVVVGAACYIGSDWAVETIKRNLFGFFPGQRTTFVRDIYTIKYGTPPDEELLARMANEAAKYNSVDSVKGVVLGAKYSPQAIQAARAEEARKQQEAALVAERKRQEAAARVEVQRRVAVTNRQAITNAVGAKKTLPLGTAALAVGGAILVFVALRGRGTSSLNGVRARANRRRKS